MTMAASARSQVTCAKPTGPVEEAQAKFGGWFYISAAACCLAALSGTGIRPLSSFSELAKGGAVVGDFATLQQPLLPIVTSAWESPRSSLRDYAFLQIRVMEEYNWSSSRADSAIEEYLRFMQLLAEAPRMELIASSDVDLVWHEHILDTLNYAQDSQNLWGRFLHHRRARTDEEFALIPESYELTKKVYEDRFGRKPPPSVWGASTDASSMCGGGGGTTGGGGLDPSASGPASQASPTPSPPTSNHSVSETTPGPSTSRQPLETEEKSKTAMGAATGKTSIARTISSFIMPLALASAAFGLL